jgi:hypothetical protein
MTAKAQRASIMALLAMILYVLLFGSPVKQKVEVVPVSDSDREKWKQGRIDGKSDYAHAEKQKTASTLRLHSS